MDSFERARARTQLRREGVCSWRRVDPGVGLEQAGLLVLVVGERETFSPGRSWLAVALVGRRIAVISDVGPVDRCKGSGVH